MSAEKMKAKKVLSFLLCTPAFTKRNITSILLVGAFFFVYVLAGGKIDTELPNAKKATSFGGADSSFQGGAVNQGSKSVLEPDKVLGTKPGKDRRLREEAPHIKGRVFTDEDADLASEQGAPDRSGLIQGRYKSPQSILEKRAIQKSEKKAPDPLSAIEERLREKR
jgi:hypothetical protein